MQQLSSFVATEVYTIKLTSGEEVFARVVDLGTGLTLKKPFRLQQAGNKVGLMPWLTTSDANEINIQMQHVMAIVVSSKDIKKAYMQVTSNIVIP